MARVQTCGEVASLLHAFADGALPAGERTVVEEHLADCPACSREVARIRENAAFLLEAWTPFRMPADFESGFLFDLPKKDPKRRGAPTAAAASPAGPRTVMMGAPGRSGPSPLRYIAILVVLGAVGVGAWALLSEGEAVTRHGQRTAREPVVPKDRGPGGPASPRIPPDAGKSPAGRPTAGDGRAGRPPRPGDPLLTAGDLAAAVRAAPAGGYGPVVSRGWDLLAGTPAEAAKLRAMVDGEKDPVVRAALVLCLAADGTEENRAALRTHLLDEAPEVRLAAALGLGRSLSYDNPAKRAVPAGPPLNMAVQVGALVDSPGRADLLGRLSSEGDVAVKRVLVQVLGPSATGDEEIRGRLLDGVRGAFGDELREICLKGLHGIKDPAMVGPLGEALGQPGLPQELFAPVLEAMLAADRNASAEALAGVLPGTDRPETRRQVVEALGRAGGEAAERALQQTAANDTEPTVRLAAVQGLGRFPTRATLDVLQGRAEGDADQIVRQEAERIAGMVRRTVEKSEGGGEGEAGDAGE